jgi:hypothetical protein
VREVEASVVSFAVAIDESIETFTEERKLVIRLELAAALSCFAPACHIEVVIAAGSLTLSIIVTVPEMSDGGLGIAPVVIESVKRLLDPQGAAARLAPITGATVISSSDSPTVQIGVSVLVPTNNGMSPPPPAYTASPSPAISSGEEKAGFSIFAVVGVGVGAGLCIAISIAMFVCCRRYVAMRKRRSPPCRDESNNAQNAPGEKKIKIATRTLGTASLDHPPGYAYV